MRPRIPLVAALDPLAPPQPPSLALLMRRWAIAAVALLGACGGRDTAPARAPVVSAPEGSRFLAWEAGWLAELGATDPRLALRMEDKPSAAVLERVAAAAVLRGAENVGIVGGAIDLFSYEERELELRALRLSLEQQPDDGAASSRAEKVLLVRLLDGEDLRLARERASPEAASDRVRAIVGTWGRPTSQREVAAQERLVARGLTPLIADVAAGRLVGQRVLELEDALDPLERLAVPEGYPEATRTIATLRIELGKTHPTAAAHPLPASPTLAAQIAAYFGNLPATRDRETLVARLDDEEVGLRADLKARLAKMPDGAREEVLVQAAAHVDVEAPCVHPGGPSRARAMKPPPERALVCDGVELVATASSAVAETVATVVLHDVVAIALWALDLDGGASDLDRTRTAHPLLSEVPHDRQDRLVRAALVAPSRAIAPGLAAVLLDSEGPSERRERAARWITFGDAPFDLVMASLAVQ